MYRGRFEKVVLGRGAAAIMVAGAVVGLFSILQEPARAQSTVTWQGVDFTWTQPDSNSFNATYTSGTHVLFGNVGVGNISVSGTVTPGSLTFSHAAGTYQFSGTAFNAGANPLIVTGGGTVQFGDLANTAFLARWGTTTLSGGSALNYTGGSTSITGNIGSSGSLITLNNGTLRVGSTSGSNFIYNNPITVQSGGGRLIGQFSTAQTRFNFTGNIGGSGPLTLQSSGSAGNAANAGLVLAGTNTAYTGAATIVSSLTSPAYATDRPTVTWFQNPTALLSGASSVILRDGGVLGVRFNATDSHFANVTAGPRGGIAAEAQTGGAGSLANLSAPMSFVGPGGHLILSYFLATGNLYGNSTPLPLNNTATYLIGRNAANTAVIEDVGSLSLHGGNHLFLNRRNATNSGVVLRATDLAAPSAGSTLLLEVTGGLGATTSTSSLAVTGSRPPNQNNMTTPAIQAYTGGTATGDFVRWDTATDRLIKASYSSTNINTAGPTSVVNRTSAQTLTSNRNIYALRMTAAVNLGGYTLTLGSGGLIMGGTTLSNGNLNFGSVHGVIGAYNNSTQATISANLSGTAGLTVMGTSQTLNITGTNSLSGGIWINGGAVRLSTSGANQNDVTVNAFGRLVTGVNTTDQIGGLRGSGAVSGWIASAETSSSTLEIRPATGAHVFDGAILNGNGTHILNLVKAGAGTQVFGPNSSGSYSGTTAVTGGTLLVHGDFSAAQGAVSVSGGAVLGGRGIIGGPSATLAATAVLAPGDAPGTTGRLTFNQSLDLTQGAVLSFDLGPAGTPGTDYDQIRVIGALTGSQLSAGLQFTFNLLSGFQYGQPYEVIRFGSASNLDYSDLVAISPDGHTVPDPNYGVGGWLITSDAVKIQFTHVPEPHAALLLVLGGSLLSARVRRVWRRDRESPSQSRAAPDEAPSEQPRCG